MNHDPEDEPSASTYPKMGKVYTFNGKTLEPFSIAREDLYTRLTFDPISEREAAGLFVFICSTPPEKCVAIRGARADASFRLECAQWLESIGWQQSAELRAEALRIHREILDDLEAAQKIEPAPPKTNTPTPGNS